MNFIAVLFKYTLTYHLVLSYGNRSILSNVCIILLYNYYVKMCKFTSRIHLKMLLWWFSTVALNYKSVWQKGNGLM